MTNSAQDLIVLDVSDARNPVRLNNFSMNPFPVKHQMVGNLSYVTTSGAGLELVDSFDPDSMAVVDKDPLPGNCREIRLSGGLLVAVAAVGMALSPWLRRPAAEAAAEAPTPDGQ